MTISIQQSWIWRAMKPTQPSRPGRERDTTLYPHDLARAIHLRASARDRELSPVRAGRPPRPPRRSVLQAFGRALIRVGSLLAAEAQARSDRFARPARRHNCDRTPARDAGGLRLRRAQLQPHKAISRLGSRLSGLCRGGRAVGVADRPVGRQHPAPDATGGRRRLLELYLSVVFQSIGDTITWERWEGTLEYTMMAPVRRSVQLLGSALYAVIYGLIHTAILLVVLALFFLAPISAGRTSAPRRCSWWSARPASSASACSPRSCR